jgi:hypothetical protein
LVLPEVLDRVFDSEHAGDIELLSLPQLEGMAVYFTKLIVTLLCIN